MRPISSHLMRLLDSIESQPHLPLPVADTCKPTLLDEYGEVRMTHEDHVRRRAEARAVTRHQNRHVVAFSLRVSGTSYYQVGRYFSVNTDRGKKMALAGYDLMMRNPVVQERFPELRKRMQP